MRQILPPAMQAGLTDQWRTNMAQPGIARITCSQCNASYDTENGLREHMKTAHREGTSEQGGSLRDRTEQDSASFQPAKRSGDV